MILPWDLIQEDLKDLTGPFVCPKAWDSAQLSTVTKSLKLKPFMRRGFCEQEKK